MHVVVLGAGSLGSLLGALLARGPDADVTLVGRAPHVAAVRGSGLAVEGVESFVARPAATTDLDGVDAADVVLVTVKAFDVADAAAGLAAAALDPAAVVPFANGMGNEATLADRLSSPVVAGTTTLGARLVEPGRVAWLGRGDVVVGPWVGDAGDAGETDAADAADAADLVARAFASADLAPERVAAAAVERVLWEKLAVNAAINPTTALARVPNGAVAEPPVDAVAAAAARETARVARAVDVEVAPDAAVDRAFDVARRTADNRSSMLQDVAAGRRTEVDAISGHVADRAPAGVAVPVNAALAGLLRAWERGRGLR